MSDHEAKLAAVAKILAGRVVHDQQRVQVCVKGIVLGFPATLEAIGIGYPFGVTYSLETKIIDDVNVSSEKQALRIVITPRLGRGVLSFIWRLLLFEASGQKLDIPEIDSAFVCSFDHTDQAKRFLHYPGVQDKLMNLAKYSHFRELLIRTDAGLCLSQPTSFNALDLDVCTETFRLLAEMGQVIFDHFAS